MFAKRLKKTIKQTIQNTLNSLEKDTESIVNSINAKLKKDNETKSTNLNRQLKSSFFTITSFIVIVCAILSAFPERFLTSYLGKDISLKIKDNLVTPYDQLKTFLPSEYQSYYLVIVFFVGLFLYVISRLINRKKPTLSKKQTKALAERREFLQNHVKNKKKKLYDEYLQQSVIDYESKM